VTGYGLDVEELESDSRYEAFAFSVQIGSGPTSPCVLGKGGSFAGGVKRPVTDTKQFPHSHLRLIQLQNVCSSIWTHPCLHAMMLI
jgi:hypothetical protein